MWKYLSIAGFATFKFMFAPAAAKAVDLNFIESFFCSLLGGFISAAFFYFLSEYFMKRAHQKKVAKILKAEAQGKKIKQHKNFTRTNKIIVKIKTSLGIYGTCWLVPLFLSVPVGSIICAKFYGNHKKTPYLIFLGLVLNCFIICNLVFTLSSLWK